MAGGQVQGLRTLATLYGVQTSYRAMGGASRQASPDSLLAVLKILGAPLERLADVPDALRQRRLSTSQRPLEPVHVVWDRAAARPELRIRARDTGARIECRLELEDGQSHQWTCTADELKRLGGETVEQEDFQRRELAVPIPVPFGRHRLVLEFGGQASDCWLLAAPRRAYQSQSQRRSWGVFVPLHALHSRSSWGAGDLADLEALMACVRQQGGDFVAILPLLASFFEPDVPVSPYSPASRLFWNEFYIDPQRVPELETAPAARQLLASAEFQRDIAALREAPLVDYSRQMGLKRRVLELLCDSFFESSSPRRAAFDEFLRRNPALDDYARFQAACQRQRAGWPEWPEPLRSGQLDEGTFDEQARRYHLYVQWIAEEQLGRLSQWAAETGLTWYLDLPLGVRRDGYDVWRHRAAFALGASGGAPPDPFFTKGQNWGFPPLDPARTRNDGHAYFAAVVAHHLRYAGLLRIDHAMCLHRLFWIPEGMEPSQGVYVHYPAEELYAVLTLASHRHQASIAGENLGTVPKYVNEGLARHGIDGMYVLQLELRDDVREPLRPVPREMVASLNTHDMPPFAAFCQGLDIDDRHELGLLSDSVAEENHQSRRAMVAALIDLLRREGWLETREPDLRALVEACHAFLAASPARFVLITLEDLWLERRSQNVPGTYLERPNWRRKLAYDLETVCSLPEVVAALRRVDELRHGGAAASRAAS